MDYKKIKTLLWAGGFYRKLVTLCAACFSFLALYYAFSPPEPVKAVSSGWFSGNKKQEEVKDDGVFSGVLTPIRNAAQGAGVVINKVGGEVKALVSKPEDKKAEEPAFYKKPFIWAWDNTGTVLSLTVTGIVLWWNWAYVSKSIVKAFKGAADSK